MPGKPFGFSEAAWPSMTEFGGEQAQSDFLEDLVGRLNTEQGIDLHLLGWPWSNDLNDNDHTGLMKRDGTEKLAYQTWKRLSDR
jgi:hypothetical protein